MSKEFTVTVTEVRHQEMEYRVTADTEEEANAKALSGETDEEAERGSYEVVDRILTVL